MTDAAEAWAVLTAALTFAMATAALAGSAAGLAYIAVDVFRRRPTTTKEM